MGVIDKNGAIERSYFIKRWKEEQLNALKMKYPNISEEKLNIALNRIIKKKLYNPVVIFENNYLEKMANTDLLAIIDMIHDTKPIIGGNGVLFYQHANRDNPLIKWIKSIMARRKQAKKDRSKYPKGTEEYDILNRRQNGLKLIINSLYGGFGYPGFIFANIFLSTAVTMLGQNAISSAAMGFDAFLANNCVFVEENEVYRFINFVKRESDAYELAVNNFYNPFKEIPEEKVFKKIIDNCNFNLSGKIIANIKMMIHNMTPNQRILLYYKNNLYEFCNTPIINSAIIKLHKMIPELRVPETYTLSKEAIDLIDFIWKMMYAFVVFDHPVYDRIRKNKYTYKKAVAYQDTDSNFLILGPWVNYIKSIIPEDVPTDKEELKQFEFKVVNIMTLFVTKVVTCSFKTLCHSLNIDEDHTPQLAMKNEFYFSRILFTSAKKRYVARPLLQEGIELHYPKDHEYKGFDFIKSNTKQSIRDFYSKMIYEDILIPEDINIKKIFLKIMTFEESMKNALRNGDTQYFKQSNLKAQKEYANPYAIQGIKGVMLWNTLNRDYQIQLPSDVDIIPITLEKGRRKRVAKLGEQIEWSVWKAPIGVDPETGRTIYIDNATKDMIQFAKKYPEEFEKLSREILLNPNNAIRSMGLNCIAKPKNDSIPRPEWLNDIMDVEKISNDALNLINPILKSLGITILKAGPQVEHYSNIISI